MLRKQASLLCVVLLFSLAVSLHAAVPATLQQQANAPLQNKDVLDMLKSGLSPDIVIAKIKASVCKFDTSTTTLTDMKKNAVPEAVIMAMVLAPAGGAPAPAAPPAGDPAPASGAQGATLAPRVTAVPAKPKEEDPVLSRLPAQAGMYHLRETELVKVDVKTLASAKTAGRLGHALTLGVKSVKTNAYLIGPSAKTRVTDTSPIFYIRLPEGVSIDEIALAALFVKADRRELEVSAQSGFVGSKQGLRMESIRQFESEELAPGIYKIAPNILAKGEYLFYIVGSADAVKGIQGKGYDFGVQ